MKNPATRSTLVVLLGWLIVGSGSTAVLGQGRRVVVRSPEVHQDGRVTLRIRAPQAEKVGLQGSLSGRIAETVKDDSGVWSITVGPLEPDLYEYTFLVDGVATVDMINPQLKVGRTVVNLVEVKAGEPTAYALREVPHGAVAMHWYPSKSLGQTRRLHVYLPPGYEHNRDAKYPVLYLLHGAGDDDSTWTSTGRAGFIADNLLAAGKIKPMLIVMPNGHAAPREPQRTPGQGRPSFTEGFQEDLLGDVIPYIEREYRVLPAAEHRAIAGLSMGGGQSLDVGLNHLDRFEWIGAFSSAVFAQDLSEHFPDLAADPAAANARLKLFWIGCGRDDFLLKRNESLIEWLKEKGIKHTYRLTEGAHSWSVWRGYLAELLPKLFVET